MEADSLRWSSTPGANEKRCHRLEEALLRLAMREARKEGERLLKGEPSSGSQEGGVSA